MRNMLTSMRFMLFWVLGSVIALYGIVILSLIILFASSLIAAFLFMTTHEELTSTGALIFTIIVYSIIGLVAGLIVGSVQKSLLQQKTDEAWNGWMSATAIGSVVGLNITGFIVGRQIMALIASLTIPPKGILLMLGLQLLLIPLAFIGIFQSGILMRYVNGAWAWVLANVVGGIVFVSLAVATVTGAIVAPFSVIITVLMLSAAPGIVTGFAILWLINFNWKY
jgi:hypothetical protein